MVRLLNRVSFALIFICAALTVLVAVSPGLHRIGPLAVSMRSLAIRFAD